MSRDSSSGGYIRNILPMLALFRQLSGPEAVARLVQYRLFLLRGSGGKTRRTVFFLPEEMKEGRIYEGGGFL